MYVKLLIVGLLPITLARHFPSGRHGLWTHVDPGLQFNFRNPDSESFGDHHRRQYSQYDPNFGDYTPYQVENYDRYGHYERYVDHNTENVYRHGNVPQTDQDVRNIEQSYRNSEYQNQNENRREIQHKHHDNRDESQYVNEPVNSHQSENQRNYHVDSNLSSKGRSRTIEHTVDNKQATLKTNVDSQTATYSESTPDERTNYRLEDVTPSYDNNEYEVKINEDAKSVKAVPVDQSGISEIKFSPRVADTQGSKDNLPKVSDKSETMVFADNPKPITSVKTTTDNELRFNKNREDNKSGDEKWIWMENHPSTTTTTVTPKTVPKAGAELDDRVSFTGDGCPKGEAKVLGQCVPKRN